MSINIYIIFLFKDNIYRNISIEYTIYTIIGNLIKDNFPISILAIFNDIFSRRFVKIINIGLIGFIINVIIDMGNISILINGTKNILYKMLNIFISEKLYNVIGKDTKNDIIETLNSEIK